MGQSEQSIEMVGISCSCCGGEFRVQEQSYSGKGHNPTESSCFSYNLTRGVSNRLASVSHGHRRSMMVIVVLFLIQLVLLEQCHGFNLDVENSISFNSQENGSYYGYTVAMLKRDTNTKW